MFKQLSTLAQQFGLSLPPAAPALFARYYHFLLEENKKFNLTRITRQRKDDKAFLDSLMLLVIFPDVSGPLLDLGSGAGLPGTSQTGVQ